MRLKQSLKRDIQWSNAHERLQGRINGLNSAKESPVHTCSKRQSSCWMWSLMHIKLCRSKKEYNGSNSWRKFETWPVYRWASHFFLHTEKKFCPSVQNWSRLEGRQYECQTDQIKSKFLLMLQKYINTVEKTNSYLKVVLWLFRAYQ